MKLSYREKIILAVFIAIAILFVGFLWLVKPKTQKLNDNKLKLEDLQDQKEEIDRKIEQIKPLQEKIKKIYDDTNKITEIFIPVDEVGSPVAFDKALQHYADENNVKILSLEVDTPEVEELKYYYYEGKDIDADLREAADINGNLQQQYDDEHAEQVSLSDREVETLYQTKYGVKVNGTKEDIWNYLKAIKEYNKALLINQVNISDYSFGQDAIEELQKKGQQIVEAVAQTPEETPAEEGGEEAAATEETAPEEQAQSSVSVTLDGQEITNTSDAQIVITAYSIYKMPEPDTETIPPAAN